MRWAKKRGRSVLKFTNLRVRAYEIMKIICVKDCSRVCIRYMCFGFTDENAIAMNIDCEKTDVFAYINVFYAEICLLLINDNDLDVDTLTS